MAAAKESSQSVEVCICVFEYVCVCVYGRCVSYAEWPACERQRFVTTDVTRSHGTETGHEKFKFKFKICIENTFTICTFLLPPKNAGEHIVIETDKPYATLGVGEGEWCVEWVMNCSACGFHVLSAGVNIFFSSCCCSSCYCCCRSC